MALRVAFVVNPRAGRQGGRRRRRLAARVAAAAAAAGLQAEVVETSCRGDGERLARELAADGFDVVAAVGGDGTVNEVAAGLLDGAAALGVVPFGSGNGFARDFGISLDPERACRQIAGGRARRIDAGEIAGRPFLMTAGFGIDARISHDFDRQAKGRGLLPYFRLGLTAVLSYRPPRLSLRVDGGERDIEPLLLVAANTRQFGGGAVIAPSALADDGRLDLVVVPRLPFPRLVRSAARLFSARIDFTPGVEVLRVASAEVRGDGPLEAQVDGEPVTLPACVSLGVRPAALRLWCPD